MWVSAGIKGIWSLRASGGDTFDKYLVLSFVGETRILAINDDDELDEAEMPAFDANAQVPSLLTFFPWAPLGSMLAWVVLDMDRSPSFHSESAREVPVMCVV